MNKTEYIFGNNLDSAQCVYFACSFGCGRRHCGPHVSVGVSLLDNVVGDVDTTAVKRRFPGDHHVLSVYLVKHHRANGRSWTVCKEGREPFIMLSMIV